VDIILESLRADIDGLLRIAPRIVLALFIVGSSLVLGRVLSRVVGSLLERGQLSPTHKAFFRRATTWAIVLLGLSVAMSVVGLTAAASGLVAGGGITAVVLAFAFREIGENVLAGFLLAFNRPFNIDDIVQSGEFKGTVRAVDIRTTHIRTGDGRDVFIPNAQIINRPLINFTRDGLLRPSFTLAIDYADDAGEACELLGTVARGVPGVVDEPPVLARITGLEASWVQLEVSYWIDTFAPGVRPAVIGTEVMNACRAALQEGGFTVSSEVSTNLVLSGKDPIGVRLSDVS
jgi:small-conductance mechanosensitive channel